MFVYLLWQWLIMKYPDFHSICILFNYYANCLSGAWCGIHFLRSSLVVYSFNVILELSKHFMLKIVNILTLVTRYFMLKNFIFITLVTRYHYIYYTNSSCNHANFSWFPILLSQKFLLFLFSIGGKNTTYQQMLCGLLFTFLILFSGAQLV